MNTSSDILVLSATDVKAILKDQELAVIDIVRQAYEKHARGQLVLPHSVFVRMPGANGDRGIALPALLNGSPPILGMKWITSFPANIHRGLERASAVIVLNDPNTGRPSAILEGAAISAARTAASAVLAYSVLSDEASTTDCGIIGCGRINFEIVRYLRSFRPDIVSLSLFDIDFQRATAFRTRCEETWPDCRINACQNINQLLNRTRLVSFATTASAPHVFSLKGCPQRSVILHISLRDLAPEVILSCDNVVDDRDHVCRENTSVHLAETLSGLRDFISCTLGDILLHGTAIDRCTGRPLVFSPFGLGVLDLAVATFVLDKAVTAGGGTVLRSFF